MIAIGASKRAGLLERYLISSFSLCRYVVQDAEEPEGGGPAPTFNTTLKAIVPLPERVETLPKRDYAVGQKILALYPDTSCFYKATVKGGGPQMQKVPPSKVSPIPSSVHSCR
jgi:SGF29 tudor-like domain